MRDSTTNSGARRERTPVPLLESYTLWLWVDGLAVLGYDPPDPRFPSPPPEGLALQFSFAIIAVLGIGFDGPADRDAPMALPPEIAEEVKRIEDEHRTVVSGPVESWQLGSVRQRYEFLLKRLGSPEAISAIRLRLAMVAHHEEIQRSARSFSRILETSRRRDRLVASKRRQLADLEKPQRRPYLAEGLIQPSSRQVNGHKVFALIGPEGRPVAYLDIPPGLDARSVMSKRVGVRGAIHFDETLSAQLIAVRDIDSLEQ